MFEMTVNRLAKRGENIGCSEDYTPFYCIGSRCTLGFINRFISTTRALKSIWLLLASSIIMPLGGVCIMYGCALRIFGEKFAPWPYTMTSV